MNIENGRANVADAVRYFEAGRIFEAEAACHAILAESLADATALNLLAVILCRRGELAVAIALLNEILKGNPADLQALRTLGEAFDASGQAAAAAETFARACALDAADPVLFAKLGACLLKDGKPDLAEPAIRRAVGLCPENLELFETLGGILGAMGRFGEAARVYQQALAHHPHAARLYAALGFVLVKQGRFSDATAAYGEAVARAPDRATEWLAEASFQMGLVLLGGGRHDDAAAALEQAIGLRPAWPEAHNALGLSHSGAGRLAEAIGCYARAIERDPRCVNAYTNLGAAFRSIGRLDDAVCALRTAIELAPDAADGYNNLARVFRELGQNEEAEALYDKALACDPNHAIAHFNRAWLTLLNGRLARGFAEYEWRREVWQSAVRDPDARSAGMGRRRPRRPHHPALRRAGLRRHHPVQPLHPDGAGAGGPRRPARPQPLVELFAATFPDAAVVADTDPLPAFDCHFPLMSLAWRFGTTLDTVPAPSPYLVADPTKLKAWRARLGSAPGLKVGLVWAGNPKTRHDRERSLPVQILLQHLPTEGLSLFSLQKDLRPGDEAALAAFGGRITDLAPLLHDFSDTAAAVSALDVVISVDTAVAHLAGALGRPTWVLLAHTPDWRWLLGRSDSPWYPAARLFRQGTPRAWADALAQLGEVLRQAARFHWQAQYRPLPIAAAPSGRRGGVAADASDLAGPRSRVAGRRAVRAEVVSFDVNARPSVIEWPIELPLAAGLVPGAAQGGGRVAGRLGAGR